MLGYYSKRVIIVDTIGLGFVLVAVALRLFVRKSQSIALGIDDLLIIISTALLVAVAAICIHAGAVNCYDRALFSVPDVQLLNKISFICIAILQIMYGTSKAAVILFCKRIFITPGFKIAANIILAVIFAWSFSGFFAHVFSARPIHTWWTRADPTFVVNWKAFVVYVMISNMLLDVAVWVLPITATRRLHMSTKRKVLVCSLFALGLACIIISAIRLYFAIVLYQVSIETEPARFLSMWVWLVICSDLEASLAIVLVCLPTLGPLFRRRKPIDDKYATLDSKLMVQRDMRTTLETSSSEEVRCSASDIIFPDGHLEPTQGSK